MMGISCHKDGNVDGDSICPMFICELRVPKTVNLDPKTTRLSLATWKGESGTYLWAYNQKEQKEEGSFLIFQPDSFVLFKEPDGRRAMIVGNFPDEVQVFCLSLDRYPKAQDWSQWRRPDFLAKGDVGWAFIYKQKIDVVSSNVPPDSFELRYKVEMRNLGPSYETMMKQKRDASK